MAFSSLELTKKSRFLPPKNSQNSHFVRDPWVAFFLSLRSNYLCRCEFLVSFCFFELASWSLARYRTIDNRVAHLDCRKRFANLQKNCILGAKSWTPRNSTQLVDISFFCTLIAGYIPTQGRIFLQFDCKYSLQSKTATRLNGPQSQECLIGHWLRCTLHAQKKLREKSPLIFLQNFYLKCSQEKFCVITVQFDKNSFFSISEYEVNFRDVWESWCRLCKRKESGDVRERADEKRIISSLQNFYTNLLNVARFDDFRLVRLREVSQSFYFFGQTCSSRASSSSWPASPSRASCTPWWPPAR